VVPKLCTRRTPLKYRELDGGDQILQTSWRSFPNAQQHSYLLGYNLQSFNFYILLEYKHRNLKQAHSTIWQHILSPPVISCMFRIRHDINCSLRSANRIIKPKCFANCRSSRPAALEWQTKFYNTFKVRYNWQFIIKYMLICSDFCTCNSLPKRLSWIQVRDYRQATWVSLQFYMFIYYIIHTYTHTHTHISITNQNFILKIMSEQI
jgi:hypothetical protein